MTPFRNKPLLLAALVVRMLLGVFFIVSALAKLVGIDQFEIYIFSYNLLSLNLSFLVARLVICAEVLIGIGLLANIFNPDTTTGGWTHDGVITRTSTLDDQTLEDYTPESESSDVPQAEPAAEESDA